MTQYNHTPIALGAAGDSAVVNGPLAQLDELMGDVDATGAASLAAAIGNLAALGTTTKSSIVAAIGSAALLTDYKDKMIPAINEVHSRAVTAQSTATAIAAEVGIARGGYANLDARLDALAIAGSGVYTLANGAANAGQKVIVVDSTTGILAGALLSYALVGGVVQTNTVDTIDSPTQLTVITNIGTGGIADNAYISMIPIGILMSTGAVVGAQQQMQEFEDGVRISSTSGTTAKWAIKPTYVTFSGVRDEVMFFGWNVDNHSGGRIDNSEASIYHGIEADFYVAGTGKHYSEWYVEFFDPTGAIRRRAFSTSIDRANGDLTNQYWGQHIFNLSDGTLAWQIDTAGNLGSPNLIRFTANNVNALTQLNAVGNAYISLIRLDDTDTVLVGDASSSMVAALNAAAKVGIGKYAPDVKLHVEQRDAGTNGVAGMLSITRNSSGAIAAGFGSRILFELGDAGADDTPAARIDASWDVATNSATKGDLTLYAYDTGAREGLRIRGAGSAPAIGFLGATPVARPTGVAVSAAGIHAALVSLGLIAA